MELHVDFCYSSAPMADKIYKQVVLEFLVLLISTITSINCLLQMHFHQSSYILGAAALVGAVAVPAPVPDDVPVTVADLPTPSVLGPDPLVYSSTAEPINAATVTAVVTGTTDAPEPTDSAVAVSAAAAVIDPSLVSLITNLPSSIPPSLYSQISAAVPTDPASVAVLQSAIAALPSGALPDQLASLASELLPAAATPAAKVKRSATTTYDPEASSKKCPGGNGWDCCPLPTGTAFGTTSETDTEFLSNRAYSSAASSAATRAPARYILAFSNKNAATQQTGYRGVYTLPAYDPSACAAHCDADPWCQAFNIYIERDPIVRPDDPNSAGSLCSNPPSTANIKCTLYGLPVSSTSATNDGQYQGSFHVVIAGSNGYNKLPQAPAPQPHFSGPSALLPGAIEDLSKYYLYEFYAGPFDPAYCAKGCQANTAWNKAHLRDSRGRYTACNAFNAYITYADGEAKGTTCAYYNDNLSAADIRNKATNVGQWQGSVHVTIGQSYVYNLTPRDNGGVCNCRVMGAFWPSPILDAALYGGCRD